MGGMKINTLNNMNNQEWWERQFGILFISKENGKDESKVYCQPDELKTFIKEIVTKTETAFGGCKKCYGKGYSTQLKQLHYSADFIGDKDYKEDVSPVVPCSCERGKGIKEIAIKILQTQKRELLSKIKLEKNYQGVPTSAHLTCFTAGYNQAVDDLNKLLETI